MKWEEVCSTFSHFPSFIVFLKGLQKMFSNKETPQRLLFIWKKVCDGRIILREKNNYLIKFNKLGSRIFEMCDGRTTIKEIKKEIASKYLNISSKRIDIGINKFLKEIDKKGWIRVNWDPF